MTASKGDLLIWHSALVHGGMPRNNPTLTRKSIVSHYTTQEAYPYDRRCPSAQPIARSRNGGIYYGLQRDGHVEARYALRFSDIAGSGWASNGATPPLAGRQ